MPLMMCAALAFIIVGIALALVAYARAPVSDRFAVWDLVFLAGFGLAALGGAGLMLAAVML